ncbi:MAG: fibronectin type III domain-containing protein [Spirochaetales bacterium]|nr:fibronectin type III domain-containing protein [Spirochaetales bacterium]
MKNANMICIVVSLILAVSCGLAAQQPATPPQAPGSVALDAISWCSVLVSWQDNSADEESFIISRSEDALYTSVIEITTAANTTSFIDRGTLSENSTYYYRVRAVNSAGDSAESTGGNVTTLSEPAAATGTLVADHSVINWVRQGNLEIPAILAAKAALHIGYGHTSHGSQLTDGMTGLVGFADGTGCESQYTGTPGLFNWNRGGGGEALDLREGDGYGDGDLDHDAGYLASDWETNGHQQNWYLETREYLDNPANAEINVIMWSWCGQVSSQSEETMISNYLSLMEQLEEDYPDVTFIYMTGHLNGTGTEGNLHLRNEQIRQYCTDNNKWLFDFADIETYDPDGTFYGDHYPTDGCIYDADGDGTPEYTDETTPLDNDANWAYDWQDAHTEGTDWYDCGAAHSVSVNANMKAYAAWWLWARLAGWDET